MKKIMFIMMLVLCIAAFAQANVIDNPGFEGMTLEPIPNNASDVDTWQSHASGWTVTTLQAHNGTQSAVLDSDEWTNLRQKEVFAAGADAIVNMDWTFSMWVYYDSAEAGNSVADDKFKLSLKVANWWNWGNALNYNAEIKAADLVDQQWNLIETTVTPTITEGINDLPTLIAWIEEHHANIGATPENTAMDKFIVAFEQDSANNGGKFYFDDVSLKRTHYWFDPTPAINSEVFPDTPLKLRWVLPESESATTVDVVISTNSDLSGATSVVTAGTDVEAVDVTVTENTTYYWQITTDDGVDVLVSEIMEFTTTDSNPTPVVVVGSDVLTYTVEGTVDVTVSGTVEDDGSTTNTWSFTKSPDTIADAVIATPGALSTVVTLTEAGEYTLTLSGDDGEMVGQASLKIYVGVDPCDAAKRDPRGYTAFLSDTNNDCKVSLADFALIAKNWMKDNSLNGPVVLEPVVPE